jgi:DNA (cytosine-5)-methyltransferase 1
MKGGIQMNQLTVNDFFCGCGGMGIGFQKAGYKIVGAWDFDKYAVESYKENVGAHVKKADIKDMTWLDIPKASVWAFGFPCQDLSVAGKQAGMVLECIRCGHQWKIDPEEHRGDNCPACGGNKYKSASRSGLFFEIMRLLDETEENSPEQMPKVLVAENVKGLKPFIGVLETEFQKRGYTAHIELYNSKYWGVPQNRERYYIVGIKDGENIPFQMPIEDKNPERIPKLSTVLDPEVDEKYYISDDKAKTIIEQALKRLEKLGKVHATITPDRIQKRQNGRRAKEDEEEMFTLTAQDLHEEIQNCFTTKDGTAYACTSTYQNGLVMDNPMRCRSRTVVIEEQPQIEVIGLLDISSHDHSRRVHDPDGLSPTVTAVSGGTHHIKIFDYSKYRVRKLTPTEYGRLQAFPMDNWKQVVSDTQAYKQFGNAVTTTVAAAVAEAIKEILIPQGLDKSNVIELRRPKEQTSAEFDPVEQLKSILYRKKSEIENYSEEVKKEDILALELAIELMTVARDISNKALATTRR